jgi:peptidoglycan/xylan/chitin deacetylase (PgdA/CDA1 family)
VLKSSGLSPLNLFVSEATSRSHPEVVRALADAGHVLGTETTAGPFTPFFTALKDVSSSDA